MKELHDLLPKLISMIDDEARHDAGLADRDVLARAVEPESPSDKSARACGVEVTGLSDYFDDVEWPIERTQETWTQCEVEETVRAEVIRALKGFALSIRPYEFLGEKLSIHAASHLFPSGELEILFPVFDALRQGFDHPIENSDGSCGRLAAIGQLRKKFNDIFDEAIADNEPACDLDVCMCGKMQ